MSRQLVKCSKCGWVHFVSSFEEMGQHAPLSEDDKTRLQRCFRCRAPSNTFVAAKHGDAPMLATLQGIVLPADSPLIGVRDNSGDEHWQRVLVDLGLQTDDCANSSKLFDDLARVCMCAKCIEADSDFRQEVAALVRKLSPAECERAIEIVCIDRELPDELKDMIDGYRLEARYDYLLAALTVRGIAHDDGQAASMHLAAGRPIYYGDDVYPDHIIKEFPDGRRQLVTVDGSGTIKVIRELP